MSIISYILQKLYKKFVTMMCFVHSPACTMNDLVLAVITRHVYDPHIVTCGSMHIPVLTCTIQQ